MDTLSSLACHKPMSLVEFEAMQERVLRRVSETGENDTKLARSRVGEGDLSAAAHRLPMPSRNKQIPLASTHF